MLMHAGIASQQDEHAFALLWHGRNSDMKRGAGRTVAAGLDKESTVITFSLVTVFPCAVTGSPLGTGEASDKSPGASPCWATLNETRHRRRRARNDLAR
jgi:hypothetical protein